MKYIPIHDWATLRYDPPPSAHTLRRMCKDGLIHPPPERIGNQYRVREDAIVIQAQRLPRLGKIDVLSSNDPIVNDIITRGTTPPRQQTRPAR